MYGAHSHRKGKEYLPRCGQPDVGVGERIKLRVPQEVKAEHRIALGATRTGARISEHEGLNGQEGTKKYENWHADFGYFFNSSL